MEALEERRHLVVHFCFALFKLRGLRGPSCLLVYFFSLAPKGMAGVKPFYGRRAPHSQVRALPPSTKGLQPPQGCSHHFINTVPEGAVVPKSDRVAIRGTHKYTRLDLGQATDTTELRARNNYC